MELQWNDHSAIEGSLAKSPSHRNLIVPGPDCAHSRPRHVVGAGVFRSRIGAE